MKLIPLSEIEVRGRQRKTIATGPLNELKESIKERGLLNPPVAWHDDETNTWVLVAGERRLRAISELAASDTPFYHSGQLVFKGEIPITPLGDYLDEIGRFAAELDENIQREDLDWPDRARAYAALHQLRQQGNPRQTVAATAQELATKGNSHVIAPDGRAHGAERIIRESVIISEHLDNEKIAKARNPAEAIALIYKHEEEQVLAAIVRRRLAAMPEKPEIEIRHANLLTLLPLLDPGTFDLIIADPPYGIDAGGAGFRARSPHHHNYEDTVDAARDIAQAILTEGFRLTKPRANIFIFCDIDLFPWLKLTASNMGWTSFRRPLVWMKSESEGLAPWGGQGPRITTEFIFYATKGQRGLNASPTDVFDDRRVSRTERLHAAEKPISLFRSLISCSTLPGDRILDPCCGSAASLSAALELKRQGLGIEIDQDYYNTALARVFTKP